MTDDRWRFMSDINPDPPHRACDERIAHLEAEMEELSRQLWEMATRAGERDAEIRNLRALAAHYEKAARIWEDPELVPVSELVPVWWCRTHKLPASDPATRTGEKCINWTAEKECDIVQLSIRSRDENG